MTEQVRVSKEWSVKREVTTLLVAGFLLAVVGGLIAYVAWPAEEVAGGLLEEGVVETGSAALALIGCLMAAAGQVMTTMGVIAVGVRLGTRD